MLRRVRAGSWSSAFL